MILIIHVNFELILVISFLMLLEERNFLKNYFILVQPDSKQELVHVEAKGQRTTVSWKTHRIISRCY